MSTLGIVSRNPETNEMRGSIALLGRRNPIGIEIVPNPAKHAETQPDFRIYSGANELGAGWVKVSRETGKPYISLRIAARARKGSPFLNTAQAAFYIGLNWRTLEQMRWKGIGPRFRRHGRFIRYHINDLDEWSRTNGQLSPAQGGRDA